MKVKRLISLALVSVLVLSLVACGKTENKTEVAGNTNGEHEPIVG